MSARPFWQNKTLNEMSRDEWESLCDGCGLCCLQKLQDEDSEDVYYTNLHCRYRDQDHRCTIYTERHSKVPECIWLTPEQAQEFKWLPPSCAYRLLAEGKPLFDWHPLISGDKNSVHRAGISLKGLTVADNTVKEKYWEDLIIWIA